VSSWYAGRRPLPEERRWLRWLPYIRLYALTHDEQYNMRFLPRAGGLFDQDWLLMEIRTGF